MGIRMSGGGGSVGPTTNLEVNSLGVGIAPDGTTGDALIAAGLATGGNAAPATAGDVYVGRAGGAVIGVLHLGGSASSPTGTVNAGILDSASNTTMQLVNGGETALTAGNVYIQLRHGLSFANLPAASAAFEGSLASIIDSTTAIWGATITGGGSNHVLAYCDGTNWTVAAV